MHVLCQDGCEGAHNRCAKAVAAGERRSEGRPSGLYYQSSVSRGAEPTLNKKPRLMAITGQGFLEKEMPSWECGTARD
jgi:hypothetical protein